MRLGAIDAGSNALRAVVAELDDAGALQTVATKRVPVRLGHGAFTVGVLDAQTIDAAVAAFREFRAMFDEHGVDHDRGHYRAVATSALRNSRNRDIVLHRLYAEAGINAEIISGAEEARLIRKAVRHHYRSERAPTTILDLGGGSLEVNVRNVAAWSAASLPIGTVRLMETLNLTGAITEAEAALVRRYVTALLHTMIPDTAGRELMPAVACGGNAERYAKILGGDAKDHIEIEALEQLLPTVLAADVPQRMKAWGVAPDRAEVMGVAGLVLATAGRELRIDKLLVPHVGIRDALLLELAETLPTNKRDAADARAKAVLSAARMFAARVGHDLTHGEQVRALARALFDQLGSLHGLPAELGHVLEVAAVLHDVGEVLHGRSHHKHGEYMVQSARIPGLDTPHREMVATLVRCHRKSLPSERKHGAYGAMPADRQRQVRALLALLRVADALDTDHRQSVRSLTATRRNGTVKLALDVRPGTPPPPLRKTELFEQELGCKLELA